MDKNMCTLCVTGYLAWYLREPRRFLGPSLLRHHIPAVERMSQAHLDWFDPPTVLLDCSVQNKHRAEPNGVMLLLNSCY